MYFQREVELGNINHINVDTASSKLHLHHQGAWTSM